MFPLPNVLDCSHVRFGSRLGHSTVPVLCRLPPKPVVRGRFIELTPWFGAAIVAAAGLKRQPRLSFPVLESTRPLKLGDRSMPTYKKADRHSNFPGAYVVTQKMPERDGEFEN
jgi:hypothetical protein